MIWFGKGSSDLQEKKLEKERGATRKRGKDVPTTSSANKKEEGKKRPKILDYYGTLIICGFMGGWESYNRFR